jgi:hypothetical protein
MRIFLAYIFFLFFVSISVGDSSFAINGEAAFRKGEFTEAAKAFGKASEKTPNDLRIIYNHGIALAKSGDLDGAIETLRKSAIDANPKIAVASLNALAQIYIDKIKTQLTENQNQNQNQNQIQNQTGNNIENQNEITQDKQNVIREFITKTEQYYMDILAIEPENQTTKNNIEQLRSWRTEIEKQWEQADLNKKRQTDAYNRLNWLDDWQDNIANTIAQLKEKPNTPKKYQTLYETANQQQKLVDEINAVKNEFEKQLDANNTQNKNLVDAIDQIKNNAENVKQNLDKFDENNAQKNADLTKKQLNNLKLSLAPFEKIVEEAEKIQTKLVNNNPENKEPENNQINNENNQITINPQQQINDQNKIANLMPLMLYRAKEGLTKLQSQPQPQTQPQNNNEQNQLQKSMELAIKYEPEIKNSALNAANLLSQNKRKEALPPQKNAQKLLREILNNQNQNNQQNQQNQDQKQDQNQNQDQKQNQQQNQNEQNQQQQQQQNQTKQQENKNENNSTKNEKTKQEEKAERLMKQAKRKQQEANKRREELQYYLSQPTPVDKDW